MRINNVVTKSYYMAEICFELDIKVLNKPKKDEKITGRI